MKKLSIATTVLDAAMALRREHPSRCGAARGRGAVDEGPGAGDLRLCRSSGVPAAPVSERSENAVRRLTASDALDAGAVLRDVVVSVSYRLGGIVVGAPPGR